MMRGGEILDLLETKPADKRLVIVLVIGALFLILSSALFLRYLAILAPSGYSIIDQQVAFTVEANERILTAWRGVEGGVEASLKCAYIDLFPFMPAYAAVAFAWGTLVARRFSQRLRRVGIICSLCIFPAWLADIVETGIQAVISSNVETYPPGLVPVMSTAAVIKFVFFYAAVLWCLVGSLLVLAARRRRAA